MLLQKILNTVAPMECLRCGYEGDLLCPTCLPSAFDIVPSRCFRCKKLTENYEVCKSCRSSVPLDHVWVGTVYSGVAKQIIYQLKFAPDRTVATLISRWLDEALSYTETDVVTFVPTAQNRVRSRGFDQSRVIAKHFCVSRELPFDVLLVRHGSSRQVGAEKQARESQVVGAYSAKKRLNGEKVLLIDDITTTGVTLSEAARVLKKNGAGKVDAIVFAQKI